MTKKVNIRDVAKETGVSITAVSQILNGVNRYSDATVKRVWTAVNQMNYSPNPYAKKLFTKEPIRLQSRLLMRITHRPYDTCFFSSTEHEPIRMFYFERSCMYHDYFGTNYIYRHEQGFRNRLLLNNQVDGVILGLSHRSIIEQINKRLPAVLTDLEVGYDEVGMPVINSDFVQGFSCVLERIMKTGIPGQMALICGINRSITDTFITEKSLSSDFVYAAMKTGVELKSEHILFCDISEDTNLVVMKEVIVKIADLVRNHGIRIVGPRGIVPPALQVKMLNEHGLRLPEDLILITSSDMQLHLHGVASVNYDWEKMMDTAVNVLLHQIEGKETVCGKYLVPCGNIDTDFLNSN